MSVVDTSTASLGLKETLEEICTDELERAKSRLVCNKWMRVEGMDDAFEDDLEIAGGGLAAQVPEGTEIPTTSIREGAVKRYTARKFGLRMVITEEAREDMKYKEIIQADKRLNRALYKTLDIDCTQPLVNATDTAFPMNSTGQPLASQNHVLAHGGTFSNMLSVAMAPSTAALNLVYAQLAQMVDHDGVVEGYDVKKVVYPSQQHFTWCTILKSSMDPTPGNYAAINAAKREYGGIEMVENRYWNNTTTNYAFITDAEGGPKLLWRRKPTPRSFHTEEAELKSHTVTARWDNGVTNPRSVFFVDA